MRFSLPGSLSIQRLLQRAARLAQLGTVSERDKVIEGKNGFLFLHNDANKVMLQITGATKLGKRKSSAIDRVHAERKSFCRSNDIAYRHVICPNKESVRTEELPDAYKFECFGPTVMSQYLSRHSTSYPYYDPDVLRGDAAYFYRTDSHWSDVGALTYLRAALESFADADGLDRFGSLTIDFVETERLGDLGLKLDGRLEPARMHHLPARSANITFESNMTGAGYVRQETCPAPSVSGKRALVLHDSFAQSLYLTLAELYAETLFIRTPHVDQQFVARYRPDVVWFFQAERFFLQVPSNAVVYSEWIARQERRKGKPEHGSTFIRDFFGPGSQTTAS